MAKNIEIKQKLDGKALGYSFAIISALCMLLLGILGNLGVYLGVVEMMEQWHLFFTLSIVGIVGGMIEAGVIGFLAGWLIALFYNKFA